MKYIFVAGAPGSKWSSVVKNIYYSASIDRTDYNEARTYHHDASGTMQLMHLGAYFDPGMEFGDFFDKMDQYSREDLEREFDRPFSGKGVRIIKSHVFAHHIDFIQRTWPDCPIVLVHRPNDSCLGWWTMCGEFAITYPDYSSYYKNLKHMTTQIRAQNQDIIKAMEDRPGFYSYDNRTACLNLHIEQPPEEYRQDYSQDDIRVKILSFTKDLK